MSELTWRDEPPTHEEVRSVGGDVLCAEAYYFVRGWSFNRPVMATVTLGMRRNTDDVFAPELNFRMPFGELIWEGDYQSGHDMDERTRAAMGNWRPLQWAGPIPFPRETTHNETDAGNHAGL